MFSQKRKCISGPQLFHVYNMILIEVFWCIWKIKSLNTAKQNGSYYLSVLARQCVPKSTKLHGSGYHYSPDHLFALGSWRKTGPVLTSHTSHGAGSVVFLLHTRRFLYNSSALHDKVHSAHCLSNKLLTVMNSATDRNNFYMPSNIWQ